MELSTLMHFMKEPSAWEILENGRYRWEPLAEERCGFDIESIAWAVRQELFSILVATHLAPIVLERLRQLGERTDYITGGGPVAEGKYIGFPIITSSKIEKCTKWVKEEIASEEWINDKARDILLMFTEVEKITESDKKSLFHRFLHQCALNTAISLWKKLEDIDVKTLKVMVGVFYKLPDLSDEQEEILKQLSHCPDGHPGLKGLGKKTQAVQAVSRAIESLVRKNMVDKKVHSSRNVHYSLAEAGKNYVDFLVSYEQYKKIMQLNGWPILNK
jgi:DNA-binding MarR family transcriptional regulator